MTAHTESEIARRKIPRHLLDQLMEEPQQVVPTFGRRRVYQSLLRFGGSKTYSLRTVIDDQTVPADRSHRLQNKQDPKILEHDMKVTYDQEVDVLRIILNDEDIEESDEDKPGVIIDYDEQGNVVGLEVLDASTRIANPRTLEYAVTG